MKLKNIEGENGVKSPTPETRTTRTFSKSKKKSHRVLLQERNALRKAEEKETPKMGVSMQESRMRRKRKKEDRSLRRRDIETPHQHK